MSTKSLRSVSALVLAMGVMSSAHAIVYNTGGLSFDTTNQSMWGTGSSYTKSDSFFLGEQWTNASTSFGDIYGGVTTVYDYVSYGADWLWYNTCSWPLSCPSSPPNLSNYAIGSVNTSTGAQLTINSSGKMGLEFGYSIDSGSVNANVNFAAIADIPENSMAGTFFSLNTSSQLGGGSITTQSPKVSASIDAIMQLNASVTAIGCVVGACGGGSLAIPSINLNQNILDADINSIKVLNGLYDNGDPLGEIPLANQTLTLQGAIGGVPPAPGFKLTGPGIDIGTLPPGPSVEVDLASLTLNVPDIATAGGVVNPTTIGSSGRDDFISLQLDLDGAATLFAGLPPLGVSATLFSGAGINISAGVDLVDVDAGPVLGVTQDFELVPTLMVNLGFSTGVEIAGMSGLQNSWSGAWADLPDIALLADTTFTPTFWISAMLKNSLGMDLGLVGTYDILKLTASATVDGLGNVFNFTDLSLNSLLGLDGQLFSTPKLPISLYSDTFALGNFNQIAGAAFTIRVPEPGTLWILGIALVVLAVARRRKPLSTDYLEPAH